MVTNTFEKLFFISLHENEVEHDNQWAKSPKKQSVGVYFKLTKNALLQTAFSAILPTVYLD